MSKKLRATQLHIDKGTFRKDALGRLHVKARLTKTGVFPYRVGDEIVLEYRSEDEVFRADSLETLVAAPVTIDHPRAFVTPKGEEVIGWVTKLDSNPPYVEGELVVHNDEAIKLVESGRLSEVSLGYETDLVELEGSEVEADLAQTNIKYNHVAIGPEGWARLGRDLTLRADGNSGYIMENTMQITDADKAPEEEIEISVEGEDAEEEKQEEVKSEEAPKEESVEEEKIDEEEAVEEEKIDEEEPVEDEGAEMKDALSGIEEKLDAILGMLGKRGDSKDVEELVAEAVEKKLEEAKPAVRENSALRERILGTLPESSEASSFADRIRAKG